MTGNLLLDWAVLAVSLFNTVLLIWLGLTVLLNAERRNWGVWVTGGGLLSAGAFFLSHTVIMGSGASYLNQGLNFWWRLGWIPGIVLPFSWYLVMLWYTGYWEDKETTLYKRHRFWFSAAVLSAAFLLLLLLILNPLPSLDQLANNDISVTPSVESVPALILAYPVYLMACIGLAIDVLRRPGPTGRMMGDLARDRARPWLIATSGTFLVVSLLVSGMSLWMARNAHTQTLSQITHTIAWFDLATATLIGTAIVLLGQAVVSYEIFTGKTLPRRGFLRQWYRAIFLAAGYGFLVSGSLVLNLQPIYSLLMTTLLMVAFYALLGWRSYTDRQNYIEHLRPFVASQRLYEQLLNDPSAAPQEMDTATPFRTLCREVLGARLAYLAAVGPMAPLAGPVLSYPDDQVIQLSPLAEVAAQFKSPKTLLIPLDQARFGGAAWAVSLWSERGLIGMLLLGEKENGGPYTQEEIETARNSSERLIDIRASVEMARRLMDLQRQQLAGSQVVDRRARRMLHDDVLPNLHTAMLTLFNDEDDPNSASSEAIALLADAHSQISNLLHEIPTPTVREVIKLGLVGALRQVVEDEMGSAFDKVTWDIAPEAAQQSKEIPPLTAEVLIYAAREAIRNAARHGPGSETDRPIHLNVRIQWQDGLEIIIEDDGVGLPTAQTPADNGGQGLALHSTMMAVIGGELAIESVPDEYTRVSLSLPSSAQFTR